MLGKLAFSMLQGSKGNQRKEVAKVCNWMEISNPDLLIFSNVLIGGLIEDFKAKFDFPILVTLQGDDVFLDSLKEPWRKKCLKRIKQIVDVVDGFIVQSEFFRDYMSGYFSIDPNRIHVTPLGIDTDDFVRFRNPNSELVQKSNPSFPQNSGEAANQDLSQRSTQTIGYMARLAKEKGLHHLVDGFIELKKKSNSEHIKLKVAGWLSPENESYASDQWAKLEAAGLQEGEDYQYLGAINREEKLAFFDLIDVLSVPTDYLEPKGLYALEALAAGVPVVLPSHGAFPELISSSGGGVLCKPHDKHDLANCLLALLDDPDRMKALAKSGQDYVHDHRNAETMATATSELIKKFVN